MSSRLRLPGAATLLLMTLAACGPGATAAPTTAATAAATVTPATDAPTLAPTEAAASPDARIATFCTEFATRLATAWPPADMAAAVALGPIFGDYAMNNRTYRYFKGTPLYPFGYGLSYTTFSYSGLTLPKSPIKAGDPLVVDVTVKNTGNREGDEVAQLYLSFPNVAGAPLRALRAFKRVHLKPGEAQKVRFELKERDLSMVSEAGEPLIAEGQYSISIGGGQPDTGAPTIAGKFQVKGTKVLPE